MGGDSLNRDVRLGKHLGDRAGGVGVQDRLRGLVETLGAQQVSDGIAGHGREVDQAVLAEDLGGLCHGPAGIARPELLGNLAHGLLVDDGREELPAFLQGVLQVGADERRELLLDALAQPGGGGVEGRLPESHQRRGAGHPGDGALRRHVVLDAVQQDVRDEVGIDLACRDLLDDGLVQSGHRAQCGRHPVVVLAAYDFLQGRLVGQGAAVSGEHRVGEVGDGQCRDHRAQIGV